jgi:hypothetical protein
MKPAQRRDEVWTQGMGREGMVVFFFPRERLRR